MPNRTKLPKNGGKWLKMVGNGWKWMEMDGKGWKWIEMAKKSHNGHNGQNGKNGQKRLKMAATLVNPESQQPQISTSPNLDNPKS